MEKLSLDFLHTLTSVEFELAQRKLDEATKSSKSPINKESMIGIKLRHEMINSAKRNFTNAKAHSNKQKKLGLNGFKKSSHMTGNS